jgi:hypothetical protein
MNNYHFKLSTGIKNSHDRIVAVDTEWAKNWKADEKIVPFCTSVHIIYPEVTGNIIDIDKLCMESELYFRNKYDSTQDYINMVESIFAQYVDDSTLLIGHQLSSDLHTLVQCSKIKLDTVEHLISCFRSRKLNKQNKGFKVADTRYDIKSRVVGNGSEKLRNVSLRLNIFAIQNEINKISLTKMYNQYVLDSDDEKREKLMVLNWRHAFQTALVWLVDFADNMQPYNSKFKANFLVTNDIMYEMGKGKFKYLDTEDYKHSRSIGGVREYVSKYAPQINLEDLLIK